MRSVRSAICTSGEPVSVSWSRCAAIVAALSGMCSLSASAPGWRGRRAGGDRLSRPRRRITSQRRCRDGPHQVTRTALAVATSARICSTSASTESNSRLVSELGHEPHLGQLAVQIAVEPQQIGLEQGVRLVGVERRPAAEREGSRMHRTIPDARTTPRRCRRRGGAIPGGTATFAVGKPSWRPRRSPSTTGPRTSWWRPSIAVAGRRSPRASAWRIAVDDTASRSPVGVTNPRGSTSKPCVAPIASEHLDVAAALVPEVEVLTDDETPRVQAIDEHLLDEVFRRLGGANVVEREHDRVVDVRRLDAGQALLEIGEEHRGRFGSHDRRWMTIERHHGGGARRVRPPAASLRR